MRKIIIYILLWLSLPISTIGGTIKRQVLFTFNKNEQISLGEYLSNLRSISYNFICLLEDNVTQKDILVWKGERKIIADRIILYYADVNSFDKCIYTYEIGDKAYIQLEKEKYGPYESVWYNDWYPMMSSGWRAPNINYINKHEFTFKQMGEYYIHDHDGTIYKRDDGKYVFVSQDKKHKAVLAENKRMITIDNTNYVIPIPVDLNIEKERPKLCIFNDGTCYYTQYGYDQNRKKWEFLCYYITPEEIKVIDTQKEYMDLEDKKVKSKNSISFNNAFPNFWNIPYDYDDKIGSYIAYEFSLQDKSKKHSFHAKWNYNYVLIDGRKYGTQCPIEAFYDKSSNSFGWIQIEKNQIVLYNYQL